VLFAPRADAVNTVGCEISRVPTVEFYIFERELRDCREGVFKIHIAEAIASDGGDGHFDLFVFTNCGLWRHGN
jgi:hypothetical protein